MLNLTTFRLMVTPMKIAHGKLLLLILLALCILPPFSARAGVGIYQKKEDRDPVLDKFDEKIKSEIIQIRDQFSDFKIDHVKVKGDIRAEERIFTAHAELDVTIPPSKKQFPLLIFEDFKVTQIDLSVKSKRFNKVEFQQTVPELNIEEDRYQEEKKLDFGKLHFKDGENLSRLPHFIWVNLPDEIISNGKTDAVVSISYSGKFDRMDQHPFTNLQVFLGDFWFPSLFSAKPTTEIEITIDKPWHIFCQGKLIEENIGTTSATVKYASSIPQIEPVVIAGGYYVQKEKFNGIDLYGFYFSEGEGGKKVMEKSKEYLAFFSDLIGKYPYESFAIIESPAAVGYGYPSFTAIGTLVMQMHFTEPFALGHEILHNWWGNYVEVPFGKGNWCESLTTYMANYYYVEATSGKEAALEQRRQSLEDLSINLGGKKEFLLKDFEQNQSPMDQIVGYTKGFFLFHTVRQLIGDQTFLRGIRNFYIKYGGKEATWQNILAELKIASGEKSFKIDKMFYEFLNELGIPKITLLEAYLHKDTDNGIKYRITGQLENDGDFITIYNFPYVAWFKGGGAQTGAIDLIGKYTEFEILFNDMPLGISFDPEMNAYRYIPEIDRSLNLNRFWDNPPLLVLVPKNEGIYQELAKSFKNDNPKIVAFSEFNPADVDSSDTLILLSSENLDEFQSFAKGHDLNLPKGFAFGKDTITANGTEQKGDNVALLITIANPADEVRTVSILYATSDAQLKTARGRIGFYSSQGWVVFMDKKMIDKGSFPSKNSSLTERFDSMIVCRGGSCVTEDISNR